MSKVFKITCTKDRTGAESTSTGTIAQLVEAYNYTLLTGYSYNHEKGNKKINMNPKSIVTLVNNLNAAVNNSAANGYAGKTYRSELVYIGKE